MPKTRHRMTGIDTRTGEEVRARLIEAIKTYWMENRAPPTIRNLAVMMGVTSLSYIAFHLSKMEEKGVIRIHFTDNLGFVRVEIVPEDMQVIFPARKEG